MIFAKYSCPKCIFRKISFVERRKYENLHFILLFDKQFDELANSSGEFKNNVASYNWSNLVTVILNTTSRIGIVKYEN